MLEIGIRGSGETVVTEALTARAMGSGELPVYATPAMAALIDGRKAALVDDLMTTGSTLSECARTLKEAGAARVITITFASGGDMKPAGES